MKKFLEGFKGLVVGLLMGILKAVAFVPKAVAFSLQAVSGIILLALMITITVTIITVALPIVVAALLGFISEWKWTGWWSRIKWEIDKSLKAIVAMWNGLSD